MLDFIEVVKKYVASCKTGDLHLSYTEIVEMLGKPSSNGDGDKVDAQWTIQDKNNPEIVIEVWNYKNGPNYNPGKGLTIEGVNSFSIWAETDKQKAFAEKIFGSAYLESRHW